MDCYRVFESAESVSANRDLEGTSCGSLAKYGCSAFTIVSILSIWYNAIVSNLSGISEEAGMIALNLGSKFSLGRACITPNAASRVPPEDVQKALQRHARGDWGEVDSSDHAENDRCVQQECRLLSAYRATNGVKFWVITEANRISTTVLLPEDY